MQQCSGVDLDLVVLWLPSHNCQPLQSGCVCRLPSAGRVLTGIQSLIGAAISASAQKPQTVAAAQALADALLASETCLPHDHVLCWWVESAVCQVS